MKCTEFQRHIHAFIDSEMCARELTRMQRHLEACAPCTQLHSEFRFIASVVAGRSVLPEAAAHPMLRQVHHQQETTLFDFAWEILDRIRTGIRDLDPRFFWSKATALPLTICFFAILMHQIIPVRVERLDYVMVSSLAPPFAQNVTARMGRAQLNGLADTARRLPYEDSLSLVAEITPEGTALIGDVLEYPRSTALLDAVDLSLRESHFETSGNMTTPFVIYSFQKIDVYDSARGL